MTLNETTAPPVPEPTSSTPPAVPRRTVIVALVATVVPVLVHAAYRQANEVPGDGLDLVGGVVELVYFSALLATGVLALATAVECGRKGCASQKGLIVVAMLAIVLHVAYGLVVLPRPAAAPPEVESSSAR